MLIVRSVHIFSKSGHCELQYNKKSNLNWKWVRCSLKNHFLKARISRKAGKLFSLNFYCSFSILSKLLLTLSNQFISTFAPAITSQKVSIKQNNFSHCSSSSKSQHFASISRKFVSHFFSKFSDIPHAKLFLWF